MNQLRKEYADLMVFGEFEIFDEANQSVFTFSKKSKSQTLLVVLNFSDKEQTFEKPDTGKADWKLLVGNVEDSQEALQAFEGRVFLA